MKKLGIVLSTVTLLILLSSCKDDTTCDKGYILEGNECLLSEDDSGEKNDEAIGDTLFDPTTLNPTLEGLANLHSIEHDGITRYYKLYIPEGIANDAPLLLMLHGITGYATNLMNYSEMNDLADIHKFAVVYPQGTVISNASHWNSNLSFTDVDDTGFLVSLVEHLQSEYSLSTDFTFVAGHSNGGFMSYTLACDAPETFKAIASYAGLMSGETWDTCNTTEEISILQIHGTNDSVVPNDGTMTTIGGWGGAPDVLTMLNYWKTRNSTTVEDTLVLNNITTLYSWENPLSKTYVSYYEILNQSHSWPGDNSIFEDEDTLNDTSQIIWSFFQKIIDNS